MRAVLWLPLLLSGLAACSSSEPDPPNAGDDPFWYPVALDDALDQDGDTTVQTDAVGPGTINLFDVTDVAGLSGVVGRGNPHGVGVAFVDLNGDGYADIFIANGSAEPSSYFENQRDGTFIDRTTQSGLQDLAGVDLFSVAAADYDHDGDIDLYVGAAPTDRLYQNNGQGMFTDVTAEAGAGGPPSEVSLFADGRSKVVSFGDVDGDGWLDIVSSSSTLPEPFAYLLRNRGDGTFEDITVASAVKADAFGNPCAVLWSDYDNDRDQDLWIWNDRGGHVLLNNNAGVFTDVTTLSGLDEVTITHPMGIDAADYDHDGDLDVYVSNIGNNPLLRNNGDGTFTDVTDQAGTGGDYGWGLGFEDFDNDGWPDLFVGQEDDRPYLVFRNRGGTAPRFDRLEFEHSDIVNPGLAHNVAVAFADYDHDGRVDVLTATTDGSRINLYRNATDVADQNWLHVRVPRSGMNAGGIATRVGVKTGPLVQFRDVLGGSSRASMNELTVRFGLGAYRGADWVVAQFLDDEEGQVVFTNVDGNQRLELSP